jgi:hypothetical protein
MGGPGSGRRRDSKDTTSSFLQLDVRWLQRRGLLAPGRTFSLQWTPENKRVASIRVHTEQDRVFLFYQHRANHEDDCRSEEYPIVLEWTRCHYGGMRAWFLCPVRGCGRRVAILHGSDIFACRHCHKLAYESQQLRSRLLLLFDDFSADESIKKMESRSRYALPCSNSFP